MRRIWAKAALLVAAIALNAQTGLTPDAKRGQQIYERGTSSTGGQVEALVGGGTKVPASVLPCVNCHRYDGLGRAEGGVNPSDIRWDVLTKPYPFTDASGRTRPAYNERLLKRAITMGIDSGGNTLNSAMPRYRLSLGDATDLVAYLKEASNAPEAGVSDGAIRLGVLLSPAGTEGDAANIEREILTDYFAKGNKAGGVFGRRVDLVFFEVPADPALRAEAVRGFVKESHIFAAIGDLSGEEAAIAKVLQEESVPTIAAFADFPETALPMNRFVFYLDGGIEDEARALLDFGAARMQGAGHHVAIVHGKDALSVRTAIWLQRRLHDMGVDPVVIEEERIPASADFVYWMKPVNELGSRLDGSALPRTILIPGRFWGAMTTPMPANVEIFVASKPRLEGNDTSSRLLWERVMASASILNEGVKLTGRGLTRAGFMEALEGFQNVQTALPEPISYSVSRHVGSSHVSVMRFDPARQELKP